MYFGAAFIVSSVLLVVAECQYVQHPTQFSEHQFNSFPQPYGPFNGGFRPRMPPMPRQDPFDNIYNEQGTKLMCRMVCSPPSDLDGESATLPRADKRSSEENTVQEKA